MKDKYNNIFDEEYDNQNMNLEVKSKVIKMRGLTNNYSNPISCILTATYEALFIHINKYISLDMIYNARQMQEDIDEIIVSHKSKNYALTNAEQEMLNEEKLIVENYEQLLKRVESLIIDKWSLFSDLSNLTHINEENFTEFCNKMVEIEFKFFRGDNGCVDRSQNQNVVVEEYTTKIEKELANANILIANIDLISAMNYLTNL